MKKFLIATLSVVCLSVSVNAQVLEYKFNNNFSESCGLAPAVIPFCADSFYQDTLDSLNSLSRNVFSFGNNCGIQFDNTAAGNFLGQTYGIELYFKFENSMGFCRIMDFKNQTSDFGLYGADNVLQFYNATSSPTTAIASGSYVHLILCRDSATQLVQYYINGQLLDQFTDSTELAILDSSNVLNIFRDDLVFGGEASDGSIALLRLYNSPLDSTQAANAFANLEADLTPNNFDVNDVQQCLAGNLFSFQNTSPDTVTNTFIWYFGDGDSSTLVSSDHSYITDGIYDVMLIITSAGGCKDTVTRSIVVDAQPIPDLGQDQAICNATPILLDAGTYSGYSWSDGSTDQTLTTGLPGDYWVEVTDANGCSGIDSVRLVITPPITLGTDSAFCGTVAITLDAGSGMSTYAWSDGSTDQTLAVTDSGTYYVVIADTNGCINSDTVYFDLLELPFVDLGNDTALCSGTPLTLDAGPFYTYLWQDGTTNQTLDVTVSGFYSVQLTDISGCSNNDSVSVIIYQSPVVNLGSDSLFCGSISVVLDAGAGYSTYLWSDGSSLSTLNVSDSGWYTVLVTDSNTCQGGDTVQFYIAGLPVISLGNDTTICDGTILALSPGIGFSSYLWNDSSSLPTLDVISAGSYSVEITDSNGCLASDTISVSINPAPVVTLGSDTAVCAGDSVLLDAGSGFNSYLWSDGSSTQTIYAAATDSYMVTVTNVAGCAASDSVTVTINPLPPTPTLTYTIGNPIISDAPSGNQWYDQNGPIAGATNSFYTPIQSGAYYVIVTDGNGCQSLASNTIVWVLGISSFEYHQLQVYPNPVTDKLHLVVNESMPAGNAQVRITDLDGRMVKSFDVKIIFNTRIILDVKELVQGAYIMQIVMEEKVYNARFIKQ